MYANVNMNLGASEDINNLSIFVGPNFPYCPLPKER